MATLSDLLKEYEEAGSPPIGSEEFNGLSGPVKAAVAPNDPVYNPVVDAERNETVLDQALGGGGGAGGPIPSVAVTPGVQAKLAQLDAEYRAALVAMESQRNPSVIERTRAEGAALDALTRLRDAQTRVEQANQQLRAGELTGFIPVAALESLDQIATGEKTGPIEAGEIITLNWKGQRVGEGSGATAASADPTVALDAIAAARPDILEVAARDGGFDVSTIEGRRSAVLNWLATTDEQGVIQANRDPVLFAQGDGIIPGPGNQAIGEQARIDISQIILQEDADAWLGHVVNGVFYAKRSVADLLASGILAPGDVPEGSRFRIDNPDVLNNPDLLPFLSQQIQSRIAAGPQTSPFRALADTFFDEVGIGAFQDRKGPLAPTDTEFGQTVTSDPSGGFRFTNNAVPTLSTNALIANVRANPTDFFQSSLANLGIQVPTGFDDALQTAPIGGA